MSTEELFGELRKLNRADKLRAMELLVLELASEEAEEEALLISGTQYEVWSPFDAPAAAEKLTRMLEDEKRSQDDR
jgi:hypothetical protein